MRLMDVLPDYEIKRLSRAPILSDEDRRHYFKLDPPIEELIKPAREPHNKIGIWLNYIYFKVSGRFYNQEHFRPYDIRMAAKILGVAHPKEFTAQYSDRTRQKHRLCVVEYCGYTEFPKAEEVFENIVKDLVASQMHPRKLFYVVMEALRNKKIEVPSYDRIARSMTQKFNTFEKDAWQNISQVITSAQAEALDQLTSTAGEEYQRPLLTR